MTAELLELLPAAAHELTGDELPALGYRLSNGLRHRAPPLLGFRCWGVGSWGFGCCGLGCCGVGSSGIGCDVESEAGVATMPERNPVATGLPSSASHLSVLRSALISAHAASIASHLSKLGGK